MAKVVKYIRTINKGNHAIVVMQLDDGSEVEIYLGGQVEIWYDERYGKLKAFVKRAQSRNNQP